MNAKLKKGLKITGIVIVSFFILLLVLPFAFKGKILDLVKSEANKMLNARLEFSDLNLSFISDFPKASVALEDLSLIGIGEFSEDTLVSAKKIAVAVDIMSLFGDDGIRIHHILLDRPSVKAVKLADGQVNWDIMKADTVAAETDTVASEPSAFALQLKKFSINEGQLAYIDDSSKMQFNTSHLNLVLKGDMTEKETDIDCRMTTEKINLLMSGIPYLRNAEMEVKMKINADLENNKYTFDDNTFRLNAIEMNLDGWVALLEEGMDMDIAVNTPKLDFKDLLSLVPGIYQNNFDAMQATGNLDLKAEAQGRMVGDTLPRFALGLNVNNGVVSYEGMPQKVENITIRTAVQNPGGTPDNTTIAVEDFSFKMAGNPFRITLFASTPVSDLNFKATADGVLNLNSVKDIYPLGDSVKLNGILTAALNFAGKMSDIEKEKYENIRGEGNLKIENMNVSLSGFPDVAVHTASATVSPQAMSLNQLDVLIGKNDLHAQGKLTNYLPYVLRDEMLKGSLAVQSDYLNLNDFMTDTATGEESVSAASADTAALTVFEVPENLDLSLKATLKKVLYDNIDIQNLSGNITVSDGTARLNPLNFDAFGGSVTAKGSYSTKQNKKAPQVDFALDIKKASFEETFKQLDMIQQLVPIFAKTGGSYSVTVDLKTPLDETMSPVLDKVWAKGVLSSNDIHVQNIEAFDQLATLLKNDKFRKIEAKDIRIPFTIENGLVSTSPFDIKLGDINMNLSGTTGLDQSIDYAADIKLPASLTGGYVSNVTANIGGTFTKPVIKLNTKEVATEAVKKVVDDKLTQITGKNNEERIAALRKEADAAAEKLVKAAEAEGQKLVDKATKPLEKIAAQAAAKKLVSEAEKQAAKLREEAEKQIQKLEQE
ncbi:MAG: AsmA family protein [Coprobacter sp.]|nr:AsmA family protein [Coprobacter sp.]